MCHFANTLGNLLGEGHCNVLLRIRFFFCHRVTVGAEAIVAAPAAVCEQLASFLSTRRIFE